MKLLLIIFGVLLTYSTSFAHGHQPHTSRIVVVKTKKPVKRKVWVPAHWVKTPRGKVWISGRWKKAQKKAVR